MSQNDYTYVTYVCIKFNESLMMRRGTDHIRPQAPTSGRNRAGRLRPAPEMPPTTTTLTVKVSVPGHGPPGVSQDINY